MEGGSSAPVCGDRGGRELTGTLCGGAADVLGGDGGFGRGGGAPALPGRFRGNQQAARGDRQLARVGLLWCGKRGDGVGGGHGAVQECVPQDHPRCIGHVDADAVVEHLDGVGECCAGEAAGAVGLPLDGNSVDGVAATVDLACAGEQCAVCGVGEVVVVEPGDGVELCGVGGQAGQQRVFLGAGALFRPGRRGRGEGRYSCACGWCRMACAAVVEDAVQHVEVTESFVDAAAFEVGGGDLAEPVGVFADAAAGGGFGDHPRIGGRVLGVRAGGHEGVGVDGGEAGGLLAGAGEQAEDTFGERRRVVVRAVGDGREQRCVRGAVEVVGADDAGDRGLEFGA